MDEFIESTLDEFIESDDTDDDNTANQVKSACDEDDTGCPVMRTIGKIYGASERDDLDNTNIVKIGAHELVLDDVDYFINTRALRISRFELSNPSRGLRAALYSELGFDQTSQMTDEEVISWIVDKAINKQYINSVISDVLSTIDEIEILIVSKMAMMQRSKASLNLTLPPPAPLIDLTHPAELCEFTNSVVMYCNQLNLNSILREPVRARLTAVPIVECSKIGGGIYKPPPIDHSDPRTMRDAADREITLSVAAKKIETSINAALSRLVDALANLTTIRGGLSY